MLYKQLEMVAAEAIKDSFYMGERYDMNHVYYIDNSHWHGADRYYEYPCVYTSVLIDNYLGIQPCLDADLCIKPKVRKYGAIEFTNPRYNIRYTITGDGFRLKDLSNTTRRFKVDLSALSGPSKTIVLQPKEETNFTLPHRS